MWLAYWSNKPYNAAFITWSMNSSSVQYMSRYTVCCYITDHYYTLLSLISKQHLAVGVLGPPIHGILNYLPEILVLLFCNTYFIIRSCLKTNPFCENVLWPAPTQSLIYILILMCYKCLHCITDLFQIIVSNIHTSLFQSNKICGS